VARLDQDAEGRAIVYAIVSLATALGVRVTGEGIETASRLATLVEVGCNHGQGFLLGAPVPASRPLRRTALWPSLGQRG
jgi:EAL domain-containing protein (putative c-di-GMP-specific phosphodiesterase class I)